MGEIPHCGFQVKGAAMNHKREKASSAGNTEASGNASISAYSSPKRLRKGTKRYNVLRTFIQRGKAGLNMFEAERFCRDHVLRTTVSEFKSDFGLNFEREYETIQNEFETCCVRYWLEDEEIAKARPIVEEMA
jgi:hypothetical protein